MLRKGTYKSQEIRRAQILLRFIYTPKKGSWLNVSEMEFAAFSKQCLAGRRIGSLEEMAQQAKAWCQRRNQEGVKPTSKVKLRFLWKTGPRR